jgi:hypothetical protein
MEVAPYMNTCYFDGEKLSASCSCTAVVTKSPWPPLDKVSGWILQLHRDMMAQTIHHPLGIKTVCLACRQPGTLLSYLTACVLLTLAMQYINSIQS